MHYTLFWFTFSALPQFVTRHMNGLINLTGGVFTVNPPLQQTFQFELLFVFTHVSNYPTAAHGTCVLHSVIYFKVFFFELF